jgi:PAS domain S-box-containing protein
MDRFKKNTQTKFFSGSTKQFWKQTAGLAGFAIAYLATVRLGLLFVAQPEGVASIWPVSGLALAVLLLNPKNQWSKLLVVFFVTNAVGNWSGGNSLPVSLGFALANTLEPLLGAWALTWICKSKITFERPVEITSLFGVATVCNGITALLGAAVAELAFGSPFFNSWLVWWASDGLGMILLTPFIVSWVTSQNVFRSISLRRFVEAILLTVTLAGLTRLLFGTFTLAENPGLRSYMLFPILILIALRYKLRGLTSLLFMVAIIAILNTMQGHGAFAYANQTVTERIVSVQLFLSIMTFSGLFLNAMLTQLKKSEENLRESEDKFKYLFEYSTVGNSITQPSGGMMANMALCNLLGYTQAELQNKKWQDITHPDDIELTQKRIDKLNSGEEESTRFEKRFIRKDGSVIWVDLSSALRRDKDGTPLYLMSSVNDITEQKRARESLHESEERYRSLFDNMTEGFAVHELIIDENNEPVDYKFLNVNRAFEQLTGLKREDLIGKAQRDVLPNEDPYWFSIYSRVVLTGEAIHTEHYSPALQRHYEVYSYRPAPGQFAVVFMDISERKQAEEEIRQLNASLEQRVEERTRELRDAQEQLLRHEKLAVLGQMAGSVSHELRNPLAVISNAVYFLKMILSDANDKVKEYLNLIEKNLFLSDKIVTDLLDFTRISTVDRQPVSASQLIHQTLERFPAPEGVRVTLDLPPDSPLIYADPHHVVQILGNLTLNACQSMAPKGGTLTISISVQDEMVGISVQDTGTGISPENMKKLFEPLFTTRPKGIGLGLAVSKSLIEANGGRIEVQSEPGMGSTFTIYLPIHRSAS